MNLSKIAVKRPVSTIMVILIVITFGVMSLRNIKLDMMPNMDIPIAIVSTTYRGAGSEEIESLITEPIEGILGTVPGVKEITSTSSNGSSFVILEFEDNTNIDNAALDMREKIDVIKPMLPSDADDPSVMKIDINAMTSFTLGAIANDGDLATLKTTIEDKISSRLESQDGVASVSVTGGEQKEIEIMLNEEKMRGFEISETTVSQILISENKNTPTGSVKEGNRNLSIRVLGEFKNLEEIGNLPIPTGSGSTIYLRDIAEISEVYKDKSSVIYIDGSPSVLMTIQKQSTANTVNVSEKIIQEIVKIQADYPQYTFKSIIDPADYIRDSINTVVNSALQGGILAVIILYIFLRNFKSTLVVAMAMPISIIATFCLMYYSNMTINIMSLGGLTLGIGMLVDNSIVVLESIFRKIEDGEDRFVSAIEGAREVAASVTSSTITTVAVFLPISFVGGMTAQIFNQLSLTIAFSLISSLIVSLTFVPMACSLMLSADDIKGEHDRVNIFTKVLDFLSGLIAKLEVSYEKALNFCLNKKKTTFLIVAVFVLLTLLSLNFVGQEFMPSTDEGIVQIDVNMPVGTILEDTENKSFEILALITEEEFPEIETVMLNIGSTGMLGGGSEDSATIMLQLVEKAKRSSTSEQVANKLSRHFKNVAGAEIKTSASGNSMGNYGGTGVVVHIEGEELDTLYEITSGIKASLENVAGLRDITTSVESATPQATIKVNRMKASAYGISAAEIAGVVNTAVAGSVSSTFKINGEEFDIRLRQDKGNFEYITDIESILIPTKLGVNVPLSEVAEIIKDEIPVSITRENQKRYTTVTAQLDEVDLNTASLSITNALSDYGLPEGYTWKFTGSMEEMTETFVSLGYALLMALALVYMIMAAEFESFLFPLIVMFSIPIALTGGIFGLFVTGQSLSITAFLGFIMLAGVVINNAIVLIDYTNLLIRERNMEPLAALKFAGPVRLRPILMSTLTTVLALIPMLIATNEGSELMKGLAAVVTFGLTLSTFVTLLFIPVVYMAFYNMNKNRRDKKGIRKAKKEEKIANLKTSKAMLLGDKESTKFKKKAKEESNEN